MKSNVLFRYGCALMVALAACAPRPEPGAPVPARPPAPAPPPTERATVAIGVILPQTGPSYLRPYADAVLEGVRVAVAEHEAAGRQRVELLVRDDSGSASSAANAIRELGSAGVVAVIGPLTDATLAAAARARASTDLVVIGPTATLPSPQANVYAFNVEDTASASALGRYAGGTKLRSGVLHANTPSNTAEARAFARAVSAAGGPPVLLVPFDSSATTMAAEIRRLRDARVQQVFIAANVRAIRQLIPQLGYYGLADAQILGGEVWASEDFRRDVPRAQIEGVIVATVLPRSNPAVGWSAFEEAYGSMYKRSLTSAIPALGYDAAKLVLDAKPDGRVSRGDVAREARRTDWTTGATGIFRLTAGAATRRPFLMRIRGGALQPITSGGS
jgi:ABC-type branched-subunit amino acid transport system substrate-binding protein